MPKLMLPLGLICGTTLLIVGGFLNQPEIILTGQIVLGTIAVLCVLAILL